jgi:metallo-beta-lactamase family protein
MRLQFLGAARQVTGSCFFLEGNGLKLLVDCGLYQERPFLGRNWDPFPVSPETIDAVVLTHAHLDHCGLLPRLVAQGFSGQVLATRPTADLIGIVLADSAHIQEEDAAYKKKRHEKEGRQGPHPVVPLYTGKDVAATLPLVREGDYGEEMSLNGTVSVRFHDAGHILGSAMVEIAAQENGKTRRIIFSGDIGQWDKPLVRDPSTFSEADDIVMETTYGDSGHDDPQGVRDKLRDVILSTFQKGGNIVIPTFALERAQELMFHLSHLVRDKSLPADIPVFLDSPMALDVTEAFLRHPEYLDEEALKMFRAGRSPFQFPGMTYTRKTEESKAINDRPGTSIIMAGSGMCTGGRVKHHLIHNISRPESTILFVGYQARGTLGRHILERPKEVRIHGHPRPVRARLERIDGFSAHADREGLEKWLSALKKPPRRLFCVHGEKDVSFGFARNIREKKGWNVIVPDYLDEWPLS